LLQVRLQSSKNSTIQKQALEVLLSGEGVPNKKNPPNDWAAPNDTPAKIGTRFTKYNGPYPIEVSKNMYCLLQQHLEMGGSLL
jgi:hypothetical protein